MGKSAQPVLVLMIAVVVAFGMVRMAGAATLVLEAEVLEGSGSLEPGAAQAGPVRYALIHHARAQDQPAFARWLRSHESARVTFSAKGGAPHQGVLSRLKHCFGRGLLIYADPVSFHDKDLVRVELPVKDE